MDNLRNKVTNAFVWDIFGNYGGQISSFVVSIFLARLLNPEDFGLVGMSMVFIGMLNIFMDFGFSSALIQNDNNSSLTYSSVFYLNIFAGLIITIGIFFAAPLVGEFYENPTITTLVRLLSVTFFFSSLSSVQVTILRRELLFKNVTLINLIAQISAGIVAIILAFEDFGVYALVIQQIIASVVTTTLLWGISDWKPRWEFSGQELKSLSSFSMYVFAASSVNKIIQHLDTLIIGKLFSPATLGYFSRANSLNNLITRNSSVSLTRVFFPALSQVKHDIERFERIYLKTINIVSSIAIFLTGAFYLIGEELIIGLFGAKWQASIPIFHILILKGFTYPISSMIINAFMAQGKSKENFRFGNIRKILQLIPFVFAFFGGFYPFLYASLGVAIIAWILNNIFATISLGISLKDQFFAVLPHLFVVAGIVFFIESIFSGGFNYFLTGLKLIAFCLICFIYFKFTNAPLLQEGFMMFHKFRNKSK